jgi:F0F1-type ATP synthase assembly protein I
MKKFSKLLNGKLFDVAAGFMFLVLFGIPALIVIVVIGLIFAVFSLIKRARKNNNETASQQNSERSSDDVK